MADWRNARDVADDSSVRVMTGAGGWGTGGVVSVDRGQGEVAHYVLTNAHVVAAGKADGKRVPSGHPVDGELYYLMESGNKGQAFGRLVTYSAGGVCAIGKLKLTDLHDYAMLERVDPARDPARFAKVAAAFGDAYDAEGPAFEVTPMPDAGLPGQPPKSGRYAIVGYPGDLKGKRETSTGSYHTELGGQGQNVLVLTADRAGRATRKGYSGSLIVDEETRRAVGLIAAANPEKGFGVPIDKLKTRLSEVEAFRNARVATGVASDGKACNPQDSAAWLDRATLDVAGATDYEQAYARYIAENMEGKASAPTQLGDDPIIPAAKGPARPSKAKGR